MSINSGDKKVSDKTDLFILHTVLSAIISLLIITIIYNDYSKHRSKQKGIDTLTIKK